ncbi:MAG: DNA-binding response regulator [Spirochaetes bacterium GWD1_61_31]|nr:MAG: DNA-binding response regulator [Spirochaetes bacterium GWB1_60_80]OHD31269.1 MAG: DNA-binding response regulator [Spirochaetes bacterium GWC1_61_12]OHD39451.1 MAG: DNA-binding response regulator [Spirochaetes bacterium GWD1_61_31]OHD45504.1 MAG: DNA-binding response regulator [Spirochaetes bacterium GWE1_60_18]OHD58078.1 MAG: DNA-binding response regulator [Spirochaetes bacterium GWF1_60_12]HAP44646.1 DNA-binding response regulator [Spirochaetaceae bacterium]
MAKPVILVVEDDPDIRELLAFNLGKEGYAVVQAESGESGLAACRAAVPDLVLLDIMLPGIDGLETLRRLKADHRLAGVPVLLASARGEDPDVVVGLELGADDYVIKPFSPRVLVARVRAALRRRQAAAEGLAAAGPRLAAVGLLLDSERHELLVDGHPVDLSATEFAILALLMRSPGRVYSRSGIIDAIKGPDYPVTDRSIDVQIVALRRKLGVRGACVDTVRAVGYRFLELAP